MEDIKKFFRQLDNDMLLNICYELENDVDDKVNYNKIQDRLNINIDKYLSDEIRYRYYITMRPPKLSSIDEIEDALIHAFGHDELKYRINADDRIIDVRSSRPLDMDRSLKLRGTGLRFSGLIRDLGIIQLLF